ncbi:MULTISPECIES: hypothetical protein [Bacillus]|jgi:hypothetical protein|uniref:Uncharacterized protein n=1 Tax=Bacillus smithii 7_3_47FAA TaxID=665952 RepID=G9QKB3_9BACI|nr:hypothetical protein [Bacillus smithii]AKP46303.1 hypothetical protein BSM4216_1002 [Bacillus smithii]EHL78411.1 hypothetical protein HMPREF1015_01652 [Bacillus smithii 7_3_47FAA]MED4884829.1 hypothetical protein [Bacillus smithii]MED4927084.1 hypothetical protein [Bacillus smithii]
MRGVLFFAVILDFLLFLGLCRSLLLLSRPGIYPPKKMVKKRVGALGAGTVFVFVIIILLYVT